MSLIALIPCKILYKNNVVNNHPHINRVCCVVFILIILYNLDVRV